MFLEALCLTKLQLMLDNGKHFTMTMKNNSQANKYIQKIILNNKKYTKSYITYADIMNGGTLTIEMGKKPSAKWGTSFLDRP